MSQYQRLLVIADPALRHCAALQRATALAQASGAALHVASFIEPFASLPLLDTSINQATRERYLQEHRAWLADQAELLHSKGLTVTTEAVWTKQTLEEILLHVAEMQPDMLIKNVQHEPAFKRAFITPLDWHLLRHCPVPVHLVGIGGRPLPRKVVAAVDPKYQETQSDGLNERIIDAAHGLALQCDAELHLLHTYDLSPAYPIDMSGGGLTWPNVLDDLQHSLEASFIAFAERYGVPAERRHFIMGPPVRALCDFVRFHQSDVLVMGRVQKEGLDKLIGSTTEHVLYQVPCSILAVK